MEHPQPDWPATRWSLTAPESYVLNYAGDGSGIEAFKLAVKELVARRALRIEPVETRSRLGARKERSALTEGPRSGITPEPALAPVMALFAELDKRTLQATEGSTAGMRPIEGVLLEDLAKAARPLAGFDHYRDQHVLPALVARGLMTTETRKVLGVFPSTRKAWTDTGREAVDELEQWMRVGRERLGEWVSNDPAKALAYTSGAGAAILLMGDAYPEFDLLERHLAERQAVGGSGGDGSVGAIGDRPNDEERAEAGSDVTESDLGVFDLGALGTDFGGFEGLDGAFDAIDFGVDAGGAGDGGGGGGDGGGDS